MSEGPIMRPGFRFCPTDEEIVTCYLYPKVCNMGTDLFLEDKDVYGNVPWLLPHRSNPLFRPGEWFYFARRTRLSEKNSNGKRPRRTAGEKCSSCGTWRSTGRENGIFDGENRLIGHKQILSFNVKQVGQKERVNTDWNMTEYWLAGEGFQELVVCWLRYAPKPGSPPDQAPRLVHADVGPAFPAPSIESSENSSQDSVTSDTFISGNPMVQESCGKDAMCHVLDGVCSGQSDSTMTYSQNSVISADVTLDDVSHSSSGHSSSDDPQNYQSVEHDSGLQCRNNDPMVLDNEKNRMVFEVDGVLSGQCGFFCQDFSAVFADATIAYFQNLETRKAAADMAEDTSESRGGHSSSDYTPKNHQADQSSCLPDKNNDALLSEDLMVRDRDKDTVSFALDRASSKASDGMLENIDEWIWGLPKPSNDFVDYILSAE